MKIFVAIPVYDGKLDVRVVRCLMAEQAVAHAIGDDFFVQFLPGCSHAAKGRNQLVQEFYDSGFDRMFFLDADIVWEPGSIVRLCHLPRPLIGGCYRHKLPNESYPIGWLPDPDKKGLCGDALGLTEVAALPGGFLAISKSVFEAIKQKNPEKYFEDWGKKFYCFFEMRYEDGKLWGEDTKFCEDYRASGGKVYLDPSLNLVHLNFEPVPFEGCIGKWVQSQNLNQKQPDKAKEKSSGSEANRIPVLEI